MWRSPPSITTTTTPIPAPPGSKQKTSLSDIFSEQLQEKLDREELAREEEEERAFIEEQLELFGEPADEYSTRSKEEKNDIKTTPILVASSYDENISSTPSKEEELALPPSAWNNQEGVRVVDREEENDEAASLDYALALQLQEEENESHSMHVRQTQKYGPNGHVSVVLSSSWAKTASTTTTTPHHGGRREEDEDDEEHLHLDRREEEERKLRRKLSTSGGSAERTTKHDITLNGHLNARRLERTVPNCGDLGDQLIPNKIYNSLQHRVRKQAHAEKGVSGSTVERETYATSKGLDTKSRLTIQKMLNGGLFDRVDGIVQTGKESVVFHAVGPWVPPEMKIGSPPFPSRKKIVENEEDGDDDDDDDDVLTPDSIMVGEGEGTTNASSPPPPSSARKPPPPQRQREYAIKVYKTTLNEFRNRAAYVEGDHRFDALGELSRLNPRKVIKIWAEKELKNLARSFRAGLPVPEPVRLHNHVLVMGFLGREGMGLPRLCEFEVAALPSEAVRRLFLQVLLFAHALLTRARLVHADLSEYNVLVEEPWVVRVVDFGQATDLSHPGALEFLRRDLRNVFSFFLGKGASEEPENRAKRDAVLKLMTRGTRLGEETVTVEEEQDDEDDNWSSEFTRKNLPWASSHFGGRLDSVLFNGD